MPVERVDDCVVVRFPVEVDLRNVEDVTRELVEYSDSGPAAVIIDIGATTFCGSAGIAAILNAWQVRPEGTAVCIAGESRAVTRSFGLLGLVDIVPAFTKVSEAVAEFGSGGGPRRAPDDEPVTHA
jgi:anti-anti-sigma factor